MRKLARPLISVQQLVDSVPSQGVYYFLSLTLSVCLYVCMYVTLLLQIDSSFLFLDGIKPFFGRHVALYKMLFFDF